MVTSTVVILPRDFVWFTIYRNLIKIQGFISFLKTNISTRNSIKQPTIQTRWQLSAKTMHHNVA